MSNPLSPRWALSAGLALVACANDAEERGTDRHDRHEASAEARAERREERELMVARQLAARDITDERVLAAMRAVPRHLFVPPELQAEAYGDHPLPIGEGQTISQPYVVAWMTQALELEAGERVLEIGTGSGYQAAVLAEITPQVYTIEIVRPLGERAAALFRELGYGRIETRIGDGYVGWPEAAPFDAIVVTAAPGFVPPALVEQLAPGGRLVLPVGEDAGSQELLRLSRAADGSVVSEPLGAVRFVPMTGAAQDPTVRLRDGR